MATEAIITIVISIVFSIIAAYIAIAFILPMIKALIKEVIEDNGAVAGFMSILIIVVYILLFKQIVELLSAIPAKEEGAKGLGYYLSTLQPGITILDELLPFIGWVLLGGLIAFGLRHYFKK